MYINIHTCIYIYIYIYIYILAAKLVNAFSNSTTYCYESV